MNRLLASLITLGLVASCAPGDDSAQIAGKFADLAQRSDAQSMAALFHYPSSYSEAERQDDATAVADSLKWILSKIGTPQNVESRTSPAEFYEIGVFGGDLPYWESISPIIETQFLYDATFPNVGPGYLKILMLRPKAGSSPEIHAAAFGIPSATPGARDTTIELMLGLMAHTGTPTPAGLRKALEQQLQPSRSAPGG